MAWLALLIFRNLKLRYKKIYVRSKKQLNLIDQKSFQLY